MFTPSMATGAVGAGGQFTEPTRFVALSREKPVSFVGHTTSSCLLEIRIARMGRDRPLTLKPDDAEMIANPCPPKAWRRRNRPLFAEERCPAYIPEAYR